MGIPEKMTIFGLFYLCCALAAITTCDDRKFESQTTFCSW